ncbi:hypothetical protein Tco_1317969 [Tanacetum coccineum]
MNKSLTTEESVEEHVHEVAMDVEEPILDDVVNDDDQPQDDTWFNNLLTIEKDPLTFDDLMATPIDFTKFAMNHLKKDKITKANLVGPVYKLLKGTCRSCIELEYKIEQWYLALTDKLDSTNLEGDRCPYDLRKPLPLQGTPSYLTIPVNFFFNNDIEYLKTGNTKRKYAASITKTKAARLSRHEVYSTMKILSVIRLKVDKQFGYSYLEEIVVRRADRQEYTFKEGDFLRLYLNDVEDMLLLPVQNKLFNLPGDDIVNLFSDGTLKYVHKFLHERLMNFVLGYKKYMPKRKWTDKDQIRIDIMVKKIDNQLLERRIMQSLEGLVGERKVKTEYRPLLQTV